MLMAVSTRSHPSVVTHDDDVKREMQWEGEKIYEAKYSWAMDK